MAIRRLMIAPTSMRAIRLSVPISRNPWWDLSWIGREFLAADRRIPSTTLGYASLARWEKCKNNNRLLSRVLCCS
jgi:hypothetical protein